MTDLVIQGAGASRVHAEELAARLHSSSFDVLATNAFRLKSI